jgi:hypothetical protein
MDFSGATKLSTGLVGGIFPTGIRIQFVDTHSGDMGMTKSLGWLHLPDLHVFPRTIPHELALVYG